MEVARRRGCENRAQGNVARAVRAGKSYLRRRSAGGFLTAHQEFCAAPAKGADG
jgi:hypothetical protein